MTFFTKTTTALATGVAAAFVAWAPASAQEPITVAFGDIATVESLNLLIAMERTKERGIPMELTFFNEEDVAVQAVLSGDADIGVGAPYAFIANSEAPIRMFFRMSTLLFFPVVNGEMYDDWADLDGQEVAVQSRGSGTEALMKLMEKQHGIEFSNISYVPGSEVRAGAMLQGTINATIVDSANFNLLQEKGGGKFKRLDVEGVNATDEALFGRADFLDERAADVQVFVEELLRTWKDIADNPAIVEELRVKYNLLPDLPADVVAEGVPYFEQGVAGGVYPLDGGEPQDAKDDVAFLAAAGSFDGDPTAVDPADFWDFTALEAAKAAQ